MSETQLLSRAALDAALDGVTRPDMPRAHLRDQIRAHIAALEAERDAALADNAALLEHVRSSAGENDPHATCWECNLGGHHAATCRLGRVARETPHPGAALLERLRKAEADCAELQDRYGHPDDTRAGHALLERMKRLEANVGEDGWPKDVLTVDWETWRRMSPGQRADVNSDAKRQAKAVGRPVRIFLVEQVGVEGDH